MRVKVDIKIANNCSYVQITPIELIAYSSTTVSLHRNATFANVDATEWPLTGYTGTFN